MSRFVLLSFAVLGWSYYELSGGADFEPGWYIEKDADALASAPASAPVADSAQAPREVANVPTAPARNAPASRDTSEDVTRGAQVQLASLRPAAPSDVAAQGRVSDILLTRREDVAMPEVASEASAPSAAEERVADMREVAGTRVNMRLGPGTGHSVVTQLSQGTEVEVLRAEGGWLKLRVVDSKRIGWMADYLVTAAAN
ncbi:Bacterial SH3 domain protein [Roseivivax sp. THAF40]|uniref:SH3 domain-containing protein n=1 Tax=unclassified Roseivivax TaxID=2639302 RepID=UPI0012A911CC|nr:MULTISPECIES: SH3 domain-containing protein [unclassified Roseivivax]QFS81629.1 Bacterial SH3 domain protein [Roseivivax sp. THAF197b]QFT45358.1 Bacterial SH3 domain protein [Roseivivax sp. THAF40]